MTQTAVVRRRLSRERVEVLVRRQSACSHDCESCGGGCPSMVNTPEMLAVAEDPIGVAPGQRVVVESATGRVLRLAALLYLLPFVAFFAVYLLLGSRTEGIAVLGAVAGFVAVLLGVCIPLDRYLRRHRTVTLRVISTEG